MHIPKKPSQAPDHFSSIYGLGPVQSVHSVSAKNRWISAIFGVVLISGAGLAAIYGFYDTFVQVAKYGPVMLGKTIITPLIIAAVMFLFGVLATLSAYQNWDKSVVVYEKGLAYNDNSGLQTWTWQEIEWLNISITKRYSNGIYTGTTYVYTLRKIDGARLVLDNKFYQIEMLGNFINKKVASLQYEKLALGLRSGQTITLGPVAINNNNITMNKKTYAWNEIETVAIRSGFMRIKKKNGEWFSGTAAQVSAIPNLDALLAVVDQIVKIKTG